MQELLKLVLENVHLWEVTLLLVVIWAARHPEYLKMIQSIKIGDLEIKMKQLEDEISNRKEEIRELEQEVESNRRMFGDLLEGFDANSPLAELAKTRDLLKANARAVTDLSKLADFLKPSASPEQLYAAAVTIRERRATELFDQVIECLDRLAKDKELGDIRLNTVWTLTSAVHLMLVAAIRDGATPGISRPSLNRAKSVLGVLENNPRVQDDNPAVPEKGVRGPLRHACAWIEKGLGRGEKPLFSEFP